MDDSQIDRIMRELATMRSDLTQLIDDKFVEITNDAMTRIDAVVGQVVAAEVAPMEARLNERINALDAGAIEERFQQMLNLLRDSLLAHQSQIVIDVNSTFRGIHARIEAIEHHTAKNPTMQKAVCDMARALGNMSEKIGYD